MFLKYTDTAESDLDLGRQATTSTNLNMWRPYTLVSALTKKLTGIKDRSNWVTECWSDGYKKWISGHNNNLANAFNCYNIWKTTPMLKDNFGHYKRLLLFGGCFDSETLLKSLSCVSFSLNSHIDPPHIPLQNARRKSIGEVIFPHGPVFIATKVSTTKASIREVIAQWTHCTERIAALGCPRTSGSNNSSYVSCVLITVIWIIWPSKSQTEGKPYLEGK